MWEQDTIDDIGDDDPLPPRRRRWREHVPASAFRRYFALSKSEFDRMVADGRVRTVQARNFWGVRFAAVTLAEIYRFIKANARPGPAPVDTKDSS